MEGSLSMFYYCHFLQFSEHLKYKSLRLNGFHTITIYNNSSFLRWRICSSDQVYICNKTNCVRLFVCVCVLQRERVSQRPNKRLHLTTFSHICKQQTNIYIYIVKVVVLKNQILKNLSF